MTGSARHPTGRRAAAGSCRILRRLWRPAGGNVAAEMGIVAILLTALISGTLESGMIIFQIMEVNDAAESGAAYAAINGFNCPGNPGTPQCIQTAVTAATGLQNLQATPAPSTFCGCSGTSGITAASCTTTCSNGDLAGIYVAVNAQYSFVFGNYARLLGLPNPLTATSTVRVQ
ncbi:MAG TPA: hypothetical protein VGR91_04860 [Stellaceae bacterium]|nr:hypothetical protein [Stellaceae bacterium]